MDLKDKMKKIKMKGEIPVFTRCCCCLPLRYGLLAWGYFKVGVDICFIPILAYYLMFTIFMLSLFGRGEHMGWIIVYFTIIIVAATTFMSDIIMSIVFIVGGHKKSIKLLRVYYIYNIVILGMTIFLITSSVCLSLSNTFGSDTSLRTIGTILTVYSAYFLILIVQCYFILLLRSEIIKLRAQAETFRFVNNAADAECTMVTEQKADISSPPPDMEAETV